MKGFYRLKFGIGTFSLLLICHWPKQVTWPSQSWGVGKCTPSWAKVWMQGEGIIGTDISKVQVPIERVLELVLFKICDFYIFEFTGPFFKHDESSEHCSPSKYNILLMVVSCRAVPSPPWAWRSGSLQGSFALDRACLSGEGARRPGATPAPSRQSPLLIPHAPKSLHVNTQCLMGSFFIISKIKIASSIFFWP